MQYQINQALEASNDNWGVAPSLLDSNILVATFVPPQKSVYSGGIFYAYIYVSTNTIYPFRVHMTTKIFHPNFSDLDGRVYVEKVSLLELMEYIYMLFSVPDLGPLRQCNSIASEMYNNNREKFKLIAKEWTVKYAI